MSIGHFGPVEIRYADGNQELAIGSAGYVVRPGSSDLASLVASLVNPTPVSNPVSVDASGLLEFWTTEDGAYDILVNGARIPVVAEPVDGGGEVDGGEIFVQDTASIEWSFDHNLLRTPSVSIYDQDGVMQIAYVEATATHVLVRFTTATAGRAVLS